MKELLEEMSEIASEAGVDEFALRVLLVAVADYYHSVPLCADQRDDIFKERILKWFERADDNNDPIWSDDPQGKKDPR